MSGEIKKVMERHKMLEHGGMAITNDGSAALFLGDFRAGKGEIPPTGYSPTPRLRFHGQRVEHLFDMEPKPVIRDEYVLEQEWTSVYQGQPDIWLPIPVALDE